MSHQKSTMKWNAIAIGLSGSFSKYLLSAYYPLRTLLGTLRILLHSIVKTLREVAIIIPIL